MIELKDPSLVGEVARQLRALPRPLSVRLASFHRRVCLEARDLGLPAMLLAYEGTAEDLAFVRDERHPQSMNRDRVVDPRLDQHHIAIAGDRQGRGDRGMGAGDRPARVHDPQTRGLRGRSAREHNDQTRQDRSHHTTPHTPRP